VINSRSPTRAQLS